MDVPYHYATCLESTGCLDASFIFFLSLRFWPKNLAT
jgi:hypothetical protein